MFTIALAHEGHSTSIHQGHTLHFLIFAVGVAVFFILAGRLYWQEYKRTGRWQAPK